MILTTGLKNSVYEMAFLALISVYYYLESKFPHTIYVLQGFTIVIFISVCCSLYLHDIQLLEMRSQSNNKDMYCIENTKISSLVLDNIFISYGYQLLNITSVFILPNWYQRALIFVVQALFLAFLVWYITVVSYFSVIHYALSAVLICFLFYFLEKAQRDLQKQTFEYQDSLKVWQEIFQ